MGKNTLRHNRKICKIYTRQIKSYFPIITKREKNYIKSCNIYGFYPVDRKLTLEDLYTECGHPKDIFSDYLSMTDPDLLYKQIRKTTIIKNTSIVILIITMIILFFGTLKSYDNYLRYKNDMKEANGYWIDVIE